MANREEYARQNSASARRARAVSAPPPAPVNPAALAAQPAAPSNDNIAADYQGNPPAIDYTAPSRGGAVSSPGIVNQIADTPAKRYGLALAVVLVFVVGSVALIVRS
mgnify:CR=1 FL=1